MGMTAEQAMREILGAVSPDCGLENYEFIAADVATKAAAAALTGQIDIVFNGPPGPDGGRFVEIEDERADRSMWGSGSRDQTDIARSDFTFR